MNSAWNKNVPALALAFSVVLAGCDAPAPNQGAHMPPSNGEPAATATARPAAPGADAGATAHAPAPPSVSSADGDPATPRQSPRPAQERPEGGEDPTAPAAAPRVMATVNGTPVTAAELRQALIDNLGERTTDRLDEKARRKALDALVVRRAMAQQAYERMDAQQREVLDARVRAYRELLLARHFLKAQVEPEVITAEAVAVYHHQHPEQFGGRTFWRYEVVKAEGKPQPTVRERIMAEFERLLGEEDWRKAAEGMRERGLAVKHLRSAMTKGLEQGSVAARVESAASAGEPVLWLDAGVPTVLRVVSERRVPPRPLSQVAGQVRQMLAPAYLGEAMKAVLRDVRRKARVERPPQRERLAEAGP